jgi:predicted  nucleic acid-binding Zn-ribbon protein
LQLSEKEDTINQREQQIKDYRMKNIHLQNFQKVYDYRVSTLKEEKEPLMGHLKNMDKHVRNLYNELIDEAGVK